MVQMGALTNAIWGAGVGGAMGYMNDGSMSGVMGGMAGGALAGMGSGALGGYLGGKGYSIAGGLRKGIMAGSNQLKKIGANSPRPLTPFMDNVVGGARGIRGAGANLGRSIGRNAVDVNKYGGRALMGMGMAAGGMIGASMIGSNRGY